MDHPAIAQFRKSGIKEFGVEFLLPFGMAFFVLSRIDIGGHQRAVLAQDDAVVDHGAVVEQVRDAGLLRAMSLERPGFIGLFDAPDEQSEQQQAEKRDGND